MPPPKFESAGVRNSVWIPALAALLSSLLVFIIQQIVESYQHQASQKHQRIDVSQQLGQVSARIQGTLFNNLSAIQGLTAVIAATPDITQEQFARIAQALLEDRTSLRNIAGAPGLVIKLMYPMQGNEAAVGLDYRLHPQQRASALQAVESGSAVIDGPLPLVQGGVGLIVRQPVTLLPEPGSGLRKVWGLVSAVMDIEKFYRNAGLPGDGKLDNLTIGIRHKSAEPGYEKVFYGTQGAFEGDPVILEIAVPGTDWELGAKPVSGWEGPFVSAETFMIRSVATLLALVLGIMTFYLVRNQMNLRQALRELGSSQALFQRFMDNLPAGALIQSQGSGQTLFQNHWMQTRAHLDQRLITELSKSPEVNKANPVLRHVDMGTERIYDIMLFDLPASATASSIGAIVMDVSDLVTAEQELAANRAQLRSLLNTLPDLVWLKDPDGVYLACNRRFEALFGAPEEQIVGKRDHDFVEKSLADHFRRHDLAAIKANRPSINEEVVTFASDGHTEILETIKAPVYTGSGELLGVLGIARDITERKKSEEALNTQRQMLADSQKIAHVGSWEFDRGSRLMDWSEEAYRIYGVDSETFRPSPENVFSMVHPDDRDSVRAIARNSRRQPITAELDFRITRPDGEVRTIRGRVEHDCDDAGRSIRMRGTVQDITRQKIAELALLESEERLRLALESANQGLYDLDLVTGEATVSPEYALMLGYSPDEFHETNAAWKERVHPDDRDRVYKVFEDYISGQIPDYRVEFRQCTRDQRWIWILSQGKVQKTASDGSPLRMLGTHTDITANKLVEQSLREQKQILDRTGRLAQVGGWEFDVETRTGSWTNETARIHGIPPDQPVDFAKGLSYYHGESRQHLESALANAINHAQAYDLIVQLVTRGGTQKWVRTIAEPQVEHGRVTRLVGAIQDITEQRTTQLALAKQQREASLLADLLERSSQPLAIAYTDGRIGRFNQAFLDLLGYRREEMTKTNWSEDLTPPEWHDRENRELTKLSTERKPVRYEKEYIHKDGHRMPIELYVHLVQDDPDSPPFYFAFITDITERKLAAQKIEKLNQELEKRVELRTQELQEANQELEMFTYSVSHDLKAPLRGIDGYSRLLLEGYGSQLEEEGQTFLYNVRQGVEQMSQLIEDLLAYSRMERRTLLTSPLDLNQLVNALVKTYRAELDPDQARITVALDSLQVCADKDGLSMVLRNLLDNALKFSTNQDQALIEISGKKQERSIMVEIRDNGIGFDMKFHDRIFDIFQRLQRAEEYPGTGVGLAIVRKAMSRMGGRVWARSHPGQGASFYLEVPA